MASLLSLHLLLLVSLLVFWSERAISAGFTVETLPGFEGPLPFHLETGYTELDDRQLFYYFIKSERNPEEDPLVLWLSGGPRCSSFVGLIDETGPLRFKDAKFDNADLPTMELSPYSWTKVANMIFLDAPVGTGFSYSTTGDLNMSDTKSAHDTYRFIGRWLIDNPHFLSNPLYISGDSYSGMIIPIIVQEIIRGIENNKKPLLNFKGYSLGNPITDTHLEKNAQVEFAHGMGLISTELYESLIKNCKGEYVNIDSSNIDCSKDYDSFSQCISGLNDENILEPQCPDSSKELKLLYRNRRFLGIIRQQLHSTTCRSNGNFLQGIWLNNERVRYALRIKKDTIKKWIRCNFHGRTDKVDFGVPYEFNVKSSVQYHQNISKKGYRSLIYSGDHDMLAPHGSTETWIRSLNLLIVDDWAPWLVDGQIAGYSRTFSNGMTYATVKGAGHLTPRYKPKESFIMFKKWLSNKSL